jgi:hypothetical protein
MMGWGGWSGKCRTGGGEKGSKRVCGGERCPEAGRRGTCSRLARGSVGRRGAGRGAAPGGRPSLGAQLPRTVKPRLGVMQVILTPSTRMMRQPHVARPTTMPVLPMPPSIQGSTALFLLICGGEGPGVRTGPAGGEGAGCTASRARQGAAAQ